jgi:hypothetical protein
VRSFARTFTTDLKDRKIRVNAVSPGVIPSPGYRNSLGMTEERVKQYADSVVGEIPLGRTGTLDEIAKVVSFLASDESSYITGDGVFTTWSYRAGAGRAEAFLLNPQPITARTAHEWGVVAEIVANGKSLGRAQELAELCLKAPEVTRRNTRVHFMPGCCMETRNK